MSTLAFDSLTNLVSKQPTEDAARTCDLPTRRPTRIITYAWGSEYVDALLTFTLPALLAADNLPFVAAAVPCTLVILTERRFFKTFDCHPVIEAIRRHCPVRLLKLDDLLSSSDSYGLSLTYVLHRGFADLGAAMTEHWQIFFNADFIIANGSLRNLMRELSCGRRVVAAPSYCVGAEEAIPELRKKLDPSAPRLSISHREMAGLILQHRHTVIRAKTVNQDDFHTRYMDQFYWSVDDHTLIGFQMPVAIIGLQPERYVAQPNSYWDYGLIREFCPSAEICVLGDSDQFTMLELRRKSVAADQVVAGPLNPKTTAERMILWVTPYQQDFLQFPLTLHDNDVSPDIDDARRGLRLFIDQVMVHAPQLPSHLEHPQWNYHWKRFKKNRRTRWRIVRQKFNPMVRPFFVYPLAIAKKTIRRVWSALLNRVIKPLLARRGLRVLTFAEVSKLEADLHRGEQRIIGLEADVAEREDRIANRDNRIANRDNRIVDLTNIAKEYQFKLERSYDYQLIMAQDQIRQGMSRLEPEFLATYEVCREFTMTSWERLYALYKSVRYVVENEIAGDIVECGVWRGGSMKLAAHILRSLGVTDRSLYLYDTFEGMTEPDPAVDLDAAGNLAINDWNEVQRRGVKWSYSPIEEVHETLAQVGYPMARVRLIKGPVEQTIPGVVPEKIAILRLDTDWYASTRHEMEYLYPLLSPQGVLILDDYGHYQGAARAVDDYFASHPIRPLLLRVDYSCRAAIKPIA